jgi:copper chaperone
MVWIPPRGIWYGSRIDYPPGVSTATKGQTMLHRSHPVQDTTATAAELVYRADGMTCDHCKLAVTEEVAKVAGVRAVEVDLDTKLVRVHGDGVDGMAVVAAIDEAGYDAVAA